MLKINYKFKTKNGGQYFETATHVIEKMGNYFRKKDERTSLETRKELLEFFLVEGQIVYVHEE